MGRTFQRISKFTILALVILAGFGVLYKARYHVFPVSVYSRIDMLREGTLLGKRLAHVVPDQTFFLDSDGLKIAADIFVPPGKAPAPAILMLHGSSRWGRQIAITRLLSRRLSEKGYFVLTIDFRGFGDSDDPEPVDSPLSWRVEDDIKAGIDFLAGREGVDHDRIFIVGHSMGGAYGIYGGIHDERVKKIVAIGPTRRWEERFPLEKKAFAARFVRMRKLKEKISPDLLAATQEPYIPEKTFDYFDFKVHKPLLLIDGALESKEDKIFLTTYYERMTPPKRYITLGGTGHYLGIVGFEWFEKVPFLRHLMIYDEEIVDHAVDVIGSFLSGEVTGKNRLI